MKNYKVRNVRLKRFYLSNHLYFITTVTEDRVQIFSDEENIRILLGSINDFSCRYAIKIHAFVVLPEHLHLLVTPTRDTFTISDFMKGIKGKSAIEINRRCRHEFIRANGTVKTVPTNLDCTVKTVPTNTNTKTRMWQHQFLDHVVRNDEDYRLHIEYIHNNPVKHKLCRGPEEYRWSSYRYYMHDEDAIIPISRLPV